MKSSMFTHNDHYLKYVGLTFYKYLGGVVVKTLLHHQQRVLSF